jgi:antitoxin CptB
MDNTAARRKRLLHRSRYRGFLESDLLFERFVAAHLARLDEVQLERLEALVEEDDESIWAWVTGREPVPARHDHDVFALLRGEGGRGA